MGRTLRAGQGPLSAVLLALLAVAASAALAQPAAGLAKPDPLNPKASVPALAYTSSFAQYRRLGDDAAVPWREANDTVTRIGGWRAYAREAQQPGPVPTAAPPAAPTAAPPAAKPAEMAQPAPSGHGGHKMP